MRNDRFLKACRREPTDCTPIWLMRQAGRYLPEYRALRERHSLLEMLCRPELAVEVTLMPLRRFEVDAAIIFSDLLLPLEAMGLRLSFGPEEGPRVEPPVSRREDVERLRTPPAQEALGATLQALRWTREALGESLPLIGFAGGPFTLASYAVEGGGSRHYLRTKSLMYQEPQTWHRLMEKLTALVGEFLLAQAAAGADALQLFDSWVGALSPADYREYVLPHTRSLIEKARTAGVPLIHFSTGTAGLIPELRAAGGDVIGVDWRIGLGRAWEILGPGVALQGNLDPATLLAPPEVLCRQAARVLEEAQGRPGHIFNLGHGLLPQTPVEHVQILVDFVHRWPQGEVP